MSVDFFLHVPRSGGSSIRTLLTMNYPPEQVHAFSGDFEEFTQFLSRPRHQRQAIKLVHGHFPFGLHAGLEDFRYFTLIREPVARHFSEYFYAKKHPHHQAHERINKGELSLEFWAEIGEHHAFYHSNTLCQYLSGDYNLTKPTYATFQAACSNLEKMHVFGLTGRFEESALMMAKHLGWKYPVYCRRNVIMGTKELPKDLVQKVRANQQWDIALYEYARELFAKRVREESRVLFPALEDYAAGVARASEDTEDAERVYLVGDPLPSSIWGANNLDEGSPVLDYLHSEQQHRATAFQFLEEESVLETLHVLRFSRDFLNPQAFNRAWVRVHWLGMVHVKHHPRLFHLYYGWFSFMGRDEKSQFFLEFDDPRVGRIMTNEHMFPEMIDLETGQKKRFCTYRQDTTRFEVGEDDGWQVVADPFIPEQPDSGT